MEHHLQGLPCVQLTEAKCILELFHIQLIIIYTEVAFTIYALSL